MKWFVTIATALLVVVFIDGAAFGHPDTLGTPDPYWQRMANGPSGDQVTTNVRPGTGGATHPQLLRAYVYGVGGLLAVVALGLLWSSWTSSRSPSERASRRRAAAAVRTVEVVSPSMGDELMWLLNTAGFIVVVVVYVVAFETLGSGQVASVGPKDGLLPFQTLFRDLPGTDQRMFRAMQEGVGEMARLRAADGAWPATTSLADAGIPPFARDPLDKAGLKWSERSEGLVVNYVGVPSAAGASHAFMILIQEPDPVTGEKAPQPGVVDEEHKVLTDGTLLHVTYWEQAEVALRPGVVGDPAMAGWTQIRVTSPIQEMKEWRERYLRDS